LPIPGPLGEAPRGGPIRRSVEHFHGHRRVRGATGLFQPRDGGFVLASTDAVWRMHRARDGGWTATAERLVGAHVQVWHGSDDIDVGVRTEPRMHRLDGILDSAWRGGVGELDEEEAKCRLTG